MVFLVGGLYGIALSILLFSSILTPGMIDLFVASPYTLGTHGADFEHWQGASCAFVGVVALSARSWPNAQRAPIAAALGFIYSVWGLQNLRLVLATDRYDAPMWVHVMFSCDRELGSHLVLAAPRYAPEAEALTGF